MKSKTLYIDLLSLNTESARHVAFGHLENILNETDYFIHIYALEKLDLDFLASREKIIVSKKSNIFENYFLRFLLLTILRIGFKRNSCLLSFSGFLYPFIKNQITLCQNPFPFYKKYHKSQKLKLKNSLLRFLFLRNTKTGRHIFNSNHIKNIYITNAKTKSLKAYFQKCQVVFQGVSEEANRNIFEYNQRKKNILFVSGIARHKRLLNLVMFFNDLIKSNPSYFLDIIGKVYDADYMNEIQCFIKKNNLSKKVKIHGFLSASDLAKNFQTSFVYVSLSEIESFGIPGLQAQSYGTPVIVSKGTAQEEVLNNSCISIDHNRDSFIKAIERIEKRDVWTQLHKDGIQNVINNYSWSRVSKNLINEIHRLYE